MEARGRVEHTGGVDVAVVVDGDAPGHTDWSAGDALRLAAELPGPLVFPVHVILGDKSAALAGYVKECVVPAGIKIYLPLEGSRDIDVARAIGGDSCSVVDS